MTGETVISNDPANDPRAGGLPGGHPPITTYMGLPLYFGGELVGVAGVANRKGGYTRDIADSIKPLLNTCAGITYAIRKNLASREKDRALRESETRFRTLLDKCPEAIFLYDRQGRFKDANLTALRKLGYEKEELLELHVRDIDPSFYQKEYLGNNWIQRSNSAGTTFQSGASGKKRQRLSRRSESENPGL